MENTLEWLQIQQSKELCSSFPYLFLLKATLNFLAARDFLVEAGFLTLVVLNLRADPVLAKFEAGSTLDE